MSRYPQLRWLLPAGLAVVPAFGTAYAVVYSTVVQAQRAAFQQATAFTSLPLTPADFARVFGTGANDAPAGWSPRIWEARTGDTRLGWVIVDQVIGKTDQITYAVGIGPDGAVTSLEILEYRESHGSEVRLPAWRRQFVGKRAKDPVRLESDIRNISGATLSCRHVTEGVRRLLLLAQNVLLPGAAAK